MSALGKPPLPLLRMSFMDSPLVSAYGQLTCYAVDNCNVIRRQVDYGNNLVFAVFLSEALLITLLTCLVNKRYGLRSGE